MKTNAQYILALDQGTTSSRAILFNREGVLIGSKQIAFAQHFPRPGWVEHDPYEIWKSQLEAARAAIAAAQIEAAQIVAIGITNQRETTVLWDRKTGEPVYNAIVWQCRRSAGICDDLKRAGLEALAHARTGLVLDAYFSGTKLSWLFRERPDLAARAARGELAFGTIDSWLLYKLTGVHATDPTNASRTLLFDIHKRCWDEELAHFIGIPADIALQSLTPEVKPSCGFFGLSYKELLGIEIPVMGIAGDQQASLFGHNCFSPGEVKNTYGTGCFTLMNTGPSPVESQHHLLTTVAWDLGEAAPATKATPAAEGAIQTTEGAVGAPGAAQAAARRPADSARATAPHGYSYALEGSVFVAGAVIQWLRDQMGLIADAADSEALARSVPDSGEVYVVPAFVGLGAPYWDSGARGTIVGITRGATKAHIVRAALESMAFQSRDLLAAMEADLGRQFSAIKADGGASANSFLMQFQADITNRHVVLPEVSETTALGAAYLAGLGAGYWSSLADIQQNARIKREFFPEISEERRMRLIRGWEKAVAAARCYRYT